MINENNREVLVELQGVDKFFKVGKDRDLKAVEDINLKIYRGETFGLVGESGCGKTTCGRTIIKLYEPTNGKILYEGVDVSTYNKKQNKEFKKKVQMIFQDPYASLDPKMTVGDIIAEGMRVHYPERKEDEIQQRVSDLLQTVGLNAEHSARFPHELSGGQRQRIGVARALAVDPDFIICDEPISALDVSIQAQVVNLLIDLQRNNKLTYLFISHDLSMVKHISDRIGVMYLGSLVEISSNRQIYNKPLHPYTRALISAIPIPDPNQSSADRIKLKGEIPSPIDAPKGCKFNTRCKYCMEICKKDRPELKDLGNDHRVACHLYDHGLEEGLRTMEEADRLGIPDRKADESVNVDQPSAEEIMDERKEEEIIGDAMTPTGGQNN